MMTIDILEMACNAQDDCDKCVFRILENDSLYLMYHCRYALGETNNHNVALYKLADKIADGYCPKERD